MHGTSLQELISNKIRYLQLKKKKKKAQNRNEPWEGYTQRTAGVPKLSGG